MLSVQHGGGRCRYECRYEMGQFCRSIDDDEIGVMSLSDSGKAHDVIHGDICESPIGDLKGSEQISGVFRRFVLLTFIAFANMVLNIGLHIRLIKSSSDCCIRGFLSAVVPARR